MPAQPYYTSGLLVTDTTDTTPIPVTSVRTSIAVALGVVSENLFDGYDSNNNQINTRVEYGVFIYAANGQSARIARYALLSDANDYVTNDPDGILT